jgi:signal transduction histidine kinase
MRIFFGQHPVPVFCIVVLFSSIRSFGQEYYSLNDSTPLHRMDASAEILIDPSDRISIEQITHPSYQNKFKKNNGNLTFGYLKASIWIRIRTKTTSPQKQWYLEIPAPFLEYVDFYQNLNDNKWEHSQAGYYRPHSVRTISHTSHILPLVFSQDSLNTTYIKISGASPKTFQLVIIEKERFNEKTRVEDLGYGIFFGILIVMFFYNLFIYVTLRQTNYLLYICTIVCTFLIFSSASGYAGKFLWPDHPTLNYYAGRLSLPVLSIVMTIFTIRFLEVKKYSKTMYNVLYSLIPLSILAAILLITGILSSAGNNVISLATVIYMGTGIVCRLKGNKTANYYIAAWMFYLVGGLLLTLRNSGAFDYNFWTTHFVEIGAALETIIIAFALADRYRRLKKENEEAQILALKLQLVTNEKLEVKVKERTRELSKAYEELRVILDTNSRQTRIIEDKNAELDSFFYRISHDLKGPISSLRGLSLLAKMDVKDQNALEYFEKQYQQIERLNQIITGLINLTKLNQQDLVKEKINFQKLIDECLQSFHSLPNFQNIVFKKEIEPGIEFYSEWTLVNAIIQNLIENAIKYSRAESPFVSIHVSRVSGDVLIKVEDNGQGIHEDFHVRIFDMFFRATNNASGTGLGLYILKRSVDRLGGNVDIKSDVGKGTVFTVRLPI